MWGFFKLTKVFIIVFRAHNTILFHHKITFIPGALKSWKNCGRVGRWVGRFYAIITPVVLITYNYTHLRVISVLCMRNIPYHLAWYISSCSGTQRNETSNGMLVFKVHAWSILQSDRPAPPRTASDLWDCAKIPWSAASFCWCGEIIVG